MATKVSTRTVWDRTAIAALKTEPQVAAYTHEVAEGMAAFERRLAPSKTGAGGDSIAIRDSRAKGAEDISWDADHLYMGYQELGTKFVPRTNFAGRTVDEYQHS